MVKKITKGGDEKTKVKPKREKREVLPVTIFNEDQFFDKNGKLVKIGFQDCGFTRSGRLLFNSYQREKLVFLRGKINQRIVELEERREKIKDSKDAKEKLELSIQKSKEKLEEMQSKLVALVG
ncbi:MAG: hypothetical protein FVQ84_08630 [Planctomycetes bacterium]|nr:hypothetical protein [Planctomycetota bacterium]